MAFEPKSWFAGFILNRAGNAALDRLGRHPLDDAIERALSAWAEALPDELALHSPAALFPFEAEAYTPAPAVAKLRGRLEALEMPSRDEWIAAIRAQWIDVGGRWGDDAHAFFRADIAQAGPHLDTLAARLDAVCRQDDALFKSRVLQILETQEELVETVEAHLDGMMDEIADLIGDVVEQRVDRAMARRERRELERHIQKTIDRALESQRRRLDSASVPVSGQWLVFERCAVALAPLVDDPTQAFRPGMDGPALFEALGPAVQLPPSVRAAGLEQFYVQIAPTLAGLLVQAGQTVLTAALNRLDETVERLQSLAERLEGVADLLSADDGAVAIDPLLARVRQGMLNKVLLQMDIAGLRADRELQGSFDDFFVCPALTRPRASGATETLEEPESILKTCLADARRTVVEGAPGSGKSTWTRWLQRRAMLDAADRIAIRLPLRSVGETLPTVQQLVRDAAGDHLVEEVTPPIVRRWLDAGSVALVVDGFDELPPEERDAAFDWVTGLSDAATASPVVLTSRPLTTGHLGGLPEPWAAWTLAPFDEARIEAYVKRWFRSAPIRPDDARPVDAEALAKAWRNDPTLRTLTENPLLLTTLLVVHRLDGRLPNGRAKLYQRYVDGMLGQWDSRRGVRAPDIGLDDAGRRRALRRLAVHLFIHDVEEIDRDAAVELLGTQLPMSCDASAVLDAIEERSGLFLGPGAYHFAHKSLAEFLVAEAAIEGDVSTPDGDLLDRAMLLRQRHDDRWRNVLSFWSGAAPVGQVMGLLRDCLAGATTPDVVLALSIADDQRERLSTEQIDEVLLRAARSGPPVESDARDAVFLLGGLSWDVAASWASRTVSFLLAALEGSRQLGNLLQRASSSLVDLTGATTVDSEFARYSFLLGDDDPTHLSVLLQSPPLTPADRCRRAMVGQTAIQPGFSALHFELRKNEPELAAYSAAVWLDRISQPLLAGDGGSLVIIRFVEAGRAWMGLDVPLDLLPPRPASESDGRDPLSAGIDFLAQVRGADYWTPEQEALVSDLHAWLGGLRDKRDTAAATSSPD